MDDDRWPEGGDPACWLGLVCDNCGQVREDRSLDHCQNCGASIDDEHAAAESAPAAGPLGDRGRDGGPDRDRDPAGRARNARPRDGLGRPLPYGAPGVGRLPEGVRRSPGDTLVEAQRLLDTGMPFHAHEVLEDAWKIAAEPDRALWRGLAQLAVGLTHALRGNHVGAAALLRRGTDNIGPYRDAPPHDIDVPGLIRWAGGLVRELDADLPAGTGAPRLCRIPE